MEVDSEETFVQIVESPPNMSTAAPKEHLLQKLDALEIHVESLRKATLVLAEKRESLFISLDAIKHSSQMLELDENDRDDIERYLERLQSRCTSVEISVRTERDQAQEDSLSQVNRLIDSLVVSYKSDPMRSQIKCQTYMATCTSYPDRDTDKEFETALLGCALDDQKRIKKRLFGLLQYLERSGKILPMPDF